MYNLLYTEPCARQTLSPEQVGGPDDGQVLTVHVGDVAERCQARQVSHQELQSPKGQTFIYQHLTQICTVLFLLWHQLQGFICFILSPKT